MIKWVKERIQKWRKRRERKRKLKELAEKDPFIYD